MKDIRDAGRAPVMNWRTAGPAVRHFAGRLWRSYMIRAIGMSGALTVLRVLTGVVTTKIVSVYAGPAGLALIGQLQNFVTLASTAAGAGIGPGIVKFVAEFRDDLASRRAVTSTSLWLTACCSALVGLLVLLFARPLSAALLLDGGYAPLFAIFALTLFLGAVNGVISAVLNGLMHIGRLTVLGLVGNVVSAGLTVALVLHWGVYGALLATVLSPMVGFLLSFVFVVQRRWLAWDDLAGPFHTEWLGRLSGFSLMALVGGAVSPIALLIVRWWISSTLSPAEAGYWQAVYRVSEIYLQVITIPLGTYYVPRLSAVADKLGLRAEILRGTAMLLPLAVASAWLIYALRDLIVHSLYSVDFAAASELFAFQLVGDVLKIASWLLSTIMVAKAMVRLFVITDILFNASYVVLVVVMTSAFGLRGASYAFAANYAAYLVLMVFLFRREIGLGRRS